LDLKDKIRTRQARIGIIGLGYVGLPLAVEFSKAGFEVTGFDVDLAVDAINKGRATSAT
jgi:UDP-N-acetyl-D-glucosamine dehydrogenase